MVFMYPFSDFSDFKRCLYDKTHQNSDCFEETLLKIARFARVDSVKVPKLAGTPCNTTTNLGIWTIISISVQKRITTSPLCLEAATTTAFPLGAADFLEPNLIETQNPWALLQHTIQEFCMLSTMQALYS